MDRRQTGEVSKLGSAGEASCAWPTKGRSAAPKEWRRGYKQKRTFGLRSREETAGAFGPSFDHAVTRNLIVKYQMFASSGVMPVPSAGSGYALATPAKTPFHRAIDA